MRYSEFEQYLDEDLAWRKKEISSLILISKNIQENEVLLKTVILLLYAHWEGYIKKASKLYIKYIGSKNIAIQHLTENFKAVAIKGNISRCIETRGALTLSNEIAFMNRYTKIGGNPFKVNVDPENDFDNEIIDTQANLKPKIFKNIISILGLNYKQALETRETYINTNLLANRNMIGHGSKFQMNNSDFSLSTKDIEKLKDIIISIIDNFKEELLEYTRKEFYLQAKLDERQLFEQLQEERLEKAFKSIEDSFL